MTASFPRPAGEAKAKWSRPSAAEGVARRSRSQSGQQPLGDTKNQTPGSRHGVPDTFNLRLMSGRFFRVLISARLGCPAGVGGWFPHGLRTGHGLNVEVE